VKFFLLFLVPLSLGAQQYESLTASQRVDWVVNSTVGPASLIGGAISAGFGTMVNTPHEYGTHWDGFAKRYGMRTAGVATSNLMEAGLGALTGEDPRYQRAAADATFSHRVGHIVKWTFMAPNRDGDLHPAFARFAAIAGSNALSNSWRADSEADTNHFLERTALGFVSHMAGNTWDEFWPDAKRKLFHRTSKYDQN
jgi:hypothetical protein